ncbi:acyltransferase [Grimontia sp. SpTr1]|uniref:acyltransferase n=1 Tax=Grimontia sp. SpTr1 TaxID=2995319 RepID=UPI00248C905E|nr:acyltransferase [Grimontia sp. SpTr1]
MNIGSGTVISLAATIDRTNPRGVVIGEYSYIAKGAMILTHDFINARHINTKIGNNVFIGSNAIVLPGVTIESGAIVAAGSIVTTDVKSGQIVAGNPARVMKSDVEIGKYGKKVPRP